MNERQSEETRSFRDPMAARMSAAQKHREALESEYPRVSEVYDGFYLRLNDLDEGGSRFFLSAEGIIGSELQFDGEGGFLLSDDGRRLASLPDEDAQRLATYSSADWRIKPLVSAIFFRAQGKSASADIAFICWAPLDAPYEAALSNFSHNIAERLASGDRASLALSQEQFSNVLRSGGKWFLTKTTKREPLEKGVVVYKARRSGTERLTGFALRHKMGCSVLATLFWVLVAAGIVALVWTIFF